jgi:hypothetical protein
MGRHEHSRNFHLFPDFQKKRHAKTRQVPPSHGKSGQVMGIPAKSWAVPPCPWNSTDKEGGGYIPANNYVNPTINENLADQTITTFFA